jgi:hypothetical protein
VTFWQLFSDNLESIAFYTSLVVMILGLLALVLVSFFWWLVASLYREFLAKLGVGFFRFIAAAAAVASKSAPVPAGTPMQEQPWVVTTLIAVSGYLMWEFAGAIGDHKHKLAKEKTKAAYDREIETLTVQKNVAVQQYTWLLRVVSHLRSLANEKLQRIKRVMQESTGSRGSLPETRRALAPDEHIGVILETLASLLRIEVVSTGGQHDQNFRIGLYAEQDGRLVPIDGFDLNTRSHDPFTSYQAHADRFRLDNTTNASHAVRCVLEGRMLVVPDCARDPGFQYFHDRQRNYLRSMVAYPLPDFSLDGGAPVRAALLIDTDQVGYFREEDRQNIKMSLHEFAVRLALEYTIRRLIR